MSFISIIVLSTPLLLPWAWMQDEAAQAEKRRVENQEVLAPLPDGDGKRILQSRCVDCHGLARVSAGHKNLKSWSNTLNVMIGNGASLKQEEIPVLAEYLAANFALAVNINKASAAELAKVPSLNEKLAAAIVAYREKNGVFTTIEDLTRIDGFSQELLQKIRNRITVGILPRKPQ